MNALTSDPNQVWLTDSKDSRLDVSKSATRYVTLRQKAAAANLEWLDTQDESFRHKRDDYLFRSAEIVTTIRDILGHDASKQFAKEAIRVFGPVRFWPVQANPLAHDELPVARTDGDPSQAI